MIKYKSSVRTRFKSRSFLENGKERQAPSSQELPHTSSMSLSTLEVFLNFLFQENGTLLSLSTKEMWFIKERKM